MDPIEKKICTKFQESHSNKDFRQTVVTVKNYISVSIGKNTCICIRRIAEDKPTTDSSVLPNHFFAHKKV